jgi:hypothetical protein
LGQINDGDSPVHGSATPTTLKYVILQRNVSIIKSLNPQVTADLAEDAHDHSPIEEQGMRRLDRWRDFLYHMRSRLLQGHPGRNMKKLGYSKVR